MNFNCVQAATMVVGMTVICLLNGCAREHSKEAVYQPIQTGAAGTQLNAVSTNASLAYQRYSNTNGNQTAQPTPQFSVTAGGSPALYYQWYFNSNGQQQVIAGASSNGAPTYQWYKNTNANEGAH